MLPALGAAIPMAINGLAALSTLAMLPGIWNEGEIIGAPDWTKAGKRRLARGASVRAVADDDLLGAASDVAEESLSGRLAELAGLSRGTSSPSGFASVRDGMFMEDIGKRYRRELQDASIVDGPSIAELAASTGLLG